MSNSQPAETTNQSASWLLTGIDIGKGIADPASLFSNSDTDHLGHQICSKFCETRDGSCSQGQLNEQGQLLWYQLMVTQRTTDPDYWSDNVSAVKSVVSHSIIDALESLPTGSQSLCNVAQTILGFMHHQGKIRMNRLERLNKKESKAYKGLEIFTDNIVKVQTYLSKLTGYTESELPEINHILKEAMPQLASVYCDFKTRISEECGISKEDRRDLERSLTNATDTATSLLPVDLTSRVIQMYTERIIARGGNPNSSSPGISDASLRRWAKAVKYWPEVEENFDAKRLCQILSELPKNK